MTGATVTATSPLTVQVDGSDTPVPAPWHLAAYTPTVGDRVAVSEYRGALLVHGKEQTG